MNELFRKFAHGKRAFDINPAIDIRSVGLAARNQIAATQLLLFIIGRADQAMLPGVNSGALQLPGGSSPFHEDF